MCSDLKIGVSMIYKRSRGQRETQFIKYLVPITDPLATFEFFAVSTKMINLTFLPMLHIWTDASILSYVKMLSYAKDLIIPEICGQHFNDSELHKY